MLELLAISRFIESRLKGRSVLSRVYHGFAPQKNDQDVSVFPCIIYSHMAGGDVPGLGEPVAYTQPLYLIKVAWRGGGVGQAAIILGEIDEQFRNATGEQDGFRIRVTRERPVIAPDLVNGVRYDYPGAFYRFRVEKIG